MSRSKRNIRPNPVTTSTTYSLILIFCTNCTLIRSFTPSTSILRTNKNLCLTRPQIPYYPNSHRYGTGTRLQERKSSSPYEKDKNDNPVKAGAKIYMEYLTRLWNETSTEARRRIAKDQATAAIKKVQHIVRGEEYLDVQTEEDKLLMLTACDRMLDGLHPKNETVATDDLNATAGTEEEEETELSLTEEQDSDISAVSSAPKKKKRERSILFGATMGLVAAFWVFSGNYIFTGIFTLMTILGQLEYYRMVINTGIYPARRISVMGACAMFITALLRPDLHQVCLPIFALISMTWFLTMRREVSTIAEISTTFTGMFYLGYIPSFWVRIRSFSVGWEPTRLAPLVKPFFEMIGRRGQKLPAWIPKTIHLPITDGAVFLFWTWLCLAFSDVGAYFVGKRFGKTKLGAVSPAAGATSPNKTLEGVLGACVVSGFLGVLGAWVQKWPFWYLTGAVHGVNLAILGLIGDLTASMLKRDAGLKDFGDLIPEHGGIMDRVDSFIFSAPYSWLVCVYFIPFLKTLVKARALV